MIQKMTSEKWLIGKQHIIILLYNYVSFSKTINSETPLLCFFLKYFLIKQCDIVIDRFDTKSLQIFFYLSSPLHFER